MSGRAWSEEMVEELKRLRRLGQTFGRIAKRLGVTRNAAIGKAMRIGLRVRVRQQGTVRIAEPPPLGGVREILESGVCHWIAGDVEGLWRMCGHASERDTSWCRHHLERVYEATLPAVEAKDAA